MIISGDICEIRFRNEDNGYTILVVDCDGENVIVVGSFPPVSAGEKVKLTGDFMIHPKFGKQFKAETVTKSAPDSLDSIIRYLGSGIIKGVGAKTALAIVNEFGRDTLNTIEYNPSVLSRIKGISKKKAVEISKSYRENKDMQEALMFLQDRNISLNLAIKIYNKYGKNTITCVASNPYRLIEDMDGIGFVTADRIAAEMGVSKDSGFRIRAIILHVLKESTDKNGNTYLPINELADEVLKFCSVPKERVIQYIDELTIEHKIKCCDFDGETGVMLRKSYIAERGIASKLIKLEHDAAKCQYDCQSDIDEFERINKLSFHHAQRTAIDLAVNNGVSIITGGPGTGKTTILKCLLQICEKLKQKPVLMAPTGRAAKRLSESTGFEASTIHRALMMNPENENNSASHNTKLNADIVIVDEFSMVDIYLFNSLLHHISVGTKLVIVGDKDQLPSVGAGNCLKDLLNNGLFLYTNLTKIYRQSDKSLISLNAHAINSGKMPELTTNSSSDFFFLNCKDQSVMASKIVELYCERIPKYLGIEPTKIQILCPVKNGTVGANSLNASLQEIINPIKLPLNQNKPAGYSNSFDEANSTFEKNKTNKKNAIDMFRVGDKVMHIANNYNLEWTRTIGYQVERGEGIFNGDIGSISSINKENNSLEVEMEDGRLVVYTPDIIEQLTLAYAITVHKSQGSEFDAVIMPITLGSPVIMTRNLLYTAITRAKRMVILLGDEYSIRRMVENTYIAKRYSGLTYFINEIKNDMRLLFDELP